MFDTSPEDIATSAGASPSEVCQQVLAGLKILELGHYIAAPFCTRLLADLGADVIKVEPVGGDPVRQWGEQVGGESLFWSVHARNKKSIKLDLKEEADRRILMDLVKTSDALVENFRPGQLEKMGLGPDVLRAANPRLIISRISGYGQSGPNRDKAAFGVIGEAIGGLRYLTNHAPGAHDLPPVRVGVSIGDSVAGLYAALGLMAALWQRDRTGGDGGARTIDVALTESVLSLMEAMLPEYGYLGKIKEPMGGGIATAAPSNAYPTSDRHWLLIAGNSDPLFGRLASLMKRPSLEQDARFRDNASRVRHCEELDRLIAEWTSEQDIESLQARLSAADIPNSKVYTVADIAEDPHFCFRRMVRKVEDSRLGAVLHPGVVPHISECPGEVRWAGPALDQDRDVILETLYGKSKDASRTGKA